MQSSKFFGWTMSILIGLLLTVVPYVYYRQGWAHEKRLRVITEGKMYRSGCLSAEGFRDAIERYKIRTIINLRDEAPDPSLPQNYFNRHGTLESEVCKQMGVRFEFIAMDLLPGKVQPGKRPKAIEQYLKILDDPANYPVLIHCQAGLHRTGCMAALYRMEYEGWTVAQALRELKGHGFGEWYSTSANEMVDQYVLTYQPHVRKTEGENGRMGEWDNGSKGAVAERR